MKKNVFLLAAIFAFVGLEFEAKSDVSLSRIFGNNMVLQREMSVPVWGWAEKGENVTVSFNGQECKTVADEKGKWIVRLEPMKASKIPAEFKVTGKNTIVLKNVLVGEVWVCAGGSMDSPFMWMPMSNPNRAKDMASATNSSIRHFTVRPQTNVPLNQPSCLLPLEDIHLAAWTNWSVCSPETVGAFSAMGYYFARELSTQLDVPVGIFNISWGTSKIESWIPVEELRLFPEFGDILNKVEQADSRTPVGKAKCEKFLSKMREWLPAAEKAIAAREERLPDIPVSPVQEVSEPEFPTKMFNAMVNPVIPFAIKGVVWYQGELNAQDGPIYVKKMKALAEGWRTHWGQGNFPFYYLQLPNYRQPNTSPSGDTTGWANIRDAQRIAMSEIPNCGMAVAIDIGEESDYAQVDKGESARRLAAWAFAKDYGKKDMPFCGPLYKSFKVEENKIRISFDYVGGGLMVADKKLREPVEALKDAKLSQFAIAGEDKVWKWADAVIDGDTVVVSNPEIKNPVAVRYGFSSNPSGCKLYNKEGFPASPFRTDNW